MYRALVGLALWLPCLGCSLLFEEANTDPTDGLDPLLSYDFSEEGEQTATSKGALNLDLQVIGYARIENGALNLMDVDSRFGGLALSTPPADAFISACQESREFSISMWITPGGETPIEVTPARIVTLEEASIGATNFTVGQWHDGSAPFDSIAVRTGSSSPSTTTIEVEPVGLSLGFTSWLGFTFNEAGEYLLFVDDFARSGTLDNTLSTWNPAIPLAIGAAPLGERQWKGLVHHVDLFCDALTIEELRALAAATRP